ncbi:hypothetical protein [Aliamphritea spongicola]|nr:hypothetical protein [Aliamphritea spongicola]
MAEDLPTALQAVRNAIELELSGPLLASKALAENTFVQTWIQNGEEAGTGQQIDAYLRNVKDNNQALSAFIVSDTTRNYYSDGGLSRQISPDSDQWFYNFLRSDAPFELALDVEKRLTKLRCLLIMRSLWMVGESPSVVLAARWTQWSR